MSIELDKLKFFWSTPEGKKFTEEFVKKLQREREHDDRWVEKFKQRCEGDIDGCLEKLFEKYYNDKYIKKEYKMGVEPREKLLWLVWMYAEKYCKPCKSKKYFNTFTDGAFYVGSYVIQIMHGQGSVLRFDKIKKSKTLVNYE